MSKKILLALLFGKIAEVNGIIVQIFGIDGEKRHANNIDELFHKFKKADEKATYSKGELILIIKKAQEYADKQFGESFEDVHQIIYQKYCEAITIAKQIANWH